MRKRMEIRTERIMMSVNGQTMEGYLAPPAIRVSILDCWSFFAS